MAKRGLKGEVVKGYLNRFASVPTKTLAVKIYKENKKLFTNSEDARSIVKYYRGQMGGLNRKYLKDKAFIKPLTHNTNPFKLPTSYAAIREDFLLPESANNILMLSDVHLPYHDLTALNVAIKYGKENKINTIYLNGDIVDMHKVSFHEIDPRKRSLNDEIECAREFLLALKKEFPKAKIYYKEGNHEYRLMRYLMVKAAELRDCPEFELPVILKLNELGVQWIPNKQAVKVGKLYFLHGNEFKGGGGVNPARAYYLKSKVSMIGGDKHQTSEHTEQSLDGSIVTCWSTGCLCELNPDYLPYNRWNLGFAHIIVSKSGDYNVINKRIVKGKLV